VLKPSSIVASMILEKVCGRKKNDLGVLMEEGKKVMME